ncbi:hypothetical protein FHR92_001008 [Fontibacillus solani]|uniref:Uncharacterized protein n=1 Tax=Fontibacillus solani TaxID=1572857 RepID=A0A7W3SQW6_9BACL|nr:hypothetical protein [Fontibacillus solani]MBA9084551.1 hypothetical protein [Fontibacillus solani]
MERTFYPAAYMRTIISSIHIARQKTSSLYLLAQDEKEGLRFFKLIKKTSDF